MATPTRTDAWTLLTEWTTNESLRKHALAIEASVRGYARDFGEDEDARAVVAPLHDMDYERHPTREEHPFTGCAAPHHRRSRLARPKAGSVRPY